MSVGGSRRTVVVALVGSAVLYLALFPVMYLSLGVAMGFLGIIPLTAVALSFGRWAGLAAGVLVHVVNIAYQLLLGAAWDSRLIEPHKITAWIAAVAVGFLLGQLRDVIVERKRIAERLQESNQQLEEALAEVKTLRGLLPICSSCKNIRNEEGEWVRIEEVISDQTEARLTHGICPACSKKLYPELH